VCTHVYYLIVHVCIKHVKFVSGSYVCTGQLAVNAPLSAVLMSTVGDGHVHALPLNINYFHIWKCMILTAHPI
jgi:hypothetical protein